MMGGSERFWLTHPAPRKVREALRKGMVLDIGCGPLKQIGTVGVGQWIEHELLHRGNGIRYAKTVQISAGLSAKALSALFVECV